MLAEEDAIDAWKTPSPPSPPLPGGANPPVAVSASHRARSVSGRDTKKRPSRQDGAARPSAGLASTAAADAYPAAAAPPSPAAVPTAGSLPAVRGSTASTAGPFSSTPPVPSARKNTPALGGSGKATTKKTTRSASSSQPATTKKPGSSGTTSAAKGTGKTKKASTAAPVNNTTDVESGSPATSTKEKKKAANRTASVTSAAQRSSGDGLLKAKTSKTKAASISGSSKASTARKSSAKAAGGNAKKPSATPSAGTKKSTKRASRAGSSVAISDARRKSTSTAASKKGSTTAARRGAPMRKAKRSSRASTTRSSERSGDTSKGSRRKSSVGKRRLTSKVNVMSLLEAVVEQEAETRHTLEVEEEMERDGLQPVYNVLVMELVRTQVQQLNSRQRHFTETMELLKERGFQRSAIEGADTAEALIDLLKVKLEGDATEELQRLRADNASLRARLDERTLEVDKKSSEMELLSMQLARQMAHREAENDALRAEVHATLQSTTLDVERLKKDLGHRIDIACSTFRTPKYNTAMRAMQELVAEIQREVQEHHDALSKLILSIGAKDTFAKEEGDSMHTNLPGKYRAALRALEKDNILNILDVLSFQEGVVATVGKALYVLEEIGHKTSVM